MTNFWDKPLSEYRGNIEVELCPYQLGICGEDEQVCALKSFDDVDGRQDKCAKCWAKATGEVGSVAEWFDEHECPPAKYLSPCDTHMCGRCIAMAVPKMLDAGWVA